jgi:hypothetical protein
MAAVETADSIEASANVAASTTYAASSQSGVGLDKCDQS